MTTIEVEFLGGPACGRRKTFDALDGPPPDTHAVPSVAVPLTVASYVRHPSDRKDVAWLYVHELLDLGKL